MSIKASLCAFRVKEGDFVPWNEAMVGNANLFPISQEVASAIGSGRISADAVRLCVQRGGNPEILLVGDNGAKSAKADAPAPKAKADEPKPAAKTAKV